MLKFCILDLFLLFEKYIFNSYAKLYALKCTQETYVSFFNQECNDKHKIQKYKIQKLFLIFCFRPTIVLQFLFKIV